ncbi:gluconokinase [Streptomyces oryzae]|uniref:Gluconokinase n=2 Tax=Streptomyces oryzae TaxID=1434886 RepID=A0ABS3XCL1_9ACTN|nr:gluconokinase [Streptomyces oryzae]MBO8193122.1 gluconokinase [Streptomyces oryzae]
MGVSGSGKSTVGEWLAQALGLPFADADDFHPERNIEKMSAGIPLDDADRAPWLDAMAEWLVRHADEGAVLVCSALRHRYRDRLRRASSRLFFVHLDGSYELIAARLAGREGHFMPPSLLRSQFEVLEPLGPDERGVTVSVAGAPHETRAAVRSALVRAGVC